MIKGLRIGFRAFWILLLLLVALVAGIFYALQWSEFQTNLSQKATDWLSEQLGSKVTVGNVRIKWLDEIYLEDVNIKDLQNRDMIYVREIYVNCATNFTFKGEQIINFDNNLDFVMLKEPDFKIRREENGHLNIDEWIKATALLGKAKDSLKVKTSKAFTIDEAVIENGTFQLIDDYKEAFPANQFDYYNFKIEKLAGNLKDFFIHKDTVQFHGEGIKGVNLRSDLTIKKIDTDFFYSRNMILLQKLEGRINNSIIRDYFGMYYAQPSDLSHFNTNVRLKANLRNSVFDAQDLGLFSANMYAYDEQFKVTADLTGRVVDLYMENAILGFGDASQIVGKGNFKGFPKAKTANYHLELEPSVISAVDTRQYAGEEYYKNYIEKVGKLDFSGIFKGTYDDFFTDAVLNSSNLGYLGGKVNFKIQKGTGVPIYNADLTTRALALGKITGNEELLKNISFKGKLKGSGITVKDATLDIDGNIKEVWFKGYNYRNIETKGVMRQSVFDGDILIRDPNLTAYLNGEIDFRPDLAAYDIRGEISDCNLQDLGFASENIKLHTEFDLDFDGNKFDDWLGRASFKNTFVNHEETNLVIEEMTYLSEEIGAKRNMGFRSEFFDANISGGFLPSHLVSDLIQLTNEYGLFFTGTEEDRKAYYATKVIDSLKEDYSAKYQIDLKDTEHFFAFFNPNIYLSPGGKVSGRVGIKSTSQFSLTAEIDTLIYKENAFYTNEFDFYSSKSALSPEVLTSLILMSDEQKLANSVETEMLALNGSWGNSRQIDFDGSIRQKETSNKAQLFGEVNFEEDGFSVKINPRNSRIDLLDYRWRFAENNNISIRGEELQFEDFRISIENQSLALSGFISPDPSKKLFAAINNFDLRALKPIAALEIKGVADGDVSLSNFYGDPILLSNLIVNDLDYKNILVGDVNAVVDWDRFHGNVNMDAKINREGIEILKVTGTHDPKKEDGMNLVANLEDTNLEILGTFVDEIFTDLKGYANGQLKITGNPLDPIIRGEVAFKDSQLRLNATGAYFYFNDSILFTEEGFVAKPEGFEIYDAPKGGHRAYLRGGVFNGGGGNFMLGLHGYMKDEAGFLLLNSTSKDSETFYGKVYGGGDIHLTGDFSNVLISGNLKSKPNSKLTIPLDAAQSVNVNEEAIPFAVKPKELLDEEDNEDKEETKASGGVKIAFNLTITPDTEAEIIFDRSNNDKIKAFGNSMLSLEYDSRDGSFSMSGPFVVTSGQYDFSLQNLASLRKFQIENGSRITWSGDPYNADLDIKANYRTNMDLSSIWTSTATDSESSFSQDNTRYPVDVTVSISDQLRTPKIVYGLSFDKGEIPLSHLPDLLSFEQRLKADEQLLTRNVSGVIAFNQLISETNAQDAFGQQFLVDNLTSLLSNQIGNLANKLDPNLEVGVILGDFTENLLNDLQLNFSYKFLNKRAKISGKSSYSNGLESTTTAYTEGQLSVGGELEYLLSEDGVWRLKVHSRSVPLSNYSFEATVGNVSVSGVNVLFSRNFNEFFPKTKRSSIFPKGVGKKEEVDEVSLVER